MTKSVRQWSEAMVRAGAEVVMLYDEGGIPSDGGGVEWVPLPHAGRKGLRIATRLDDALGRADVLVLHSGWTLHNAWAGARARRFHVPYILEPRGAYDPHIVARRRRIKALWHRAIEGPLIRGARAVHVFFEEEIPHLQAVGHRGPFVIVSNGVEAPTGESWDGGSGGYILWLGRFDPEHKGLDVLLRAVRALRPDLRPSLRLHGPEWRNRKSAVKAMVRDLGVEESVRVGEAVYGAEKRRLMIAAAAFVYPSRWDACPNSVLEAISLGIPSLVTPYPLGSFLSRRDAAVLAETEPESLAQGMRRVTSPPARSIGRRGAEIARTELSWDESARHWIRQVEDLL